MNSVDVVMPAAGLGTRAGRVTPKQFLFVGGIPLIIHPLRTFAAVPAVNRLIIVHHLQHRGVLEDILSEHDVKNYLLVPGGETRQASVRAGLAHVTTPRVIVHNAAVALVTPQLIEQVLAFDDDCVTTATRQEPNLVTGSEYAEAAVPRANLRVINSPQAFNSEVLRTCHQRALREGKEFSSEAELMLHYQRKVRLVPGAARNFKITTQFDLAVAETLLAQDAAAAAAQRVSA